MLKFENYLRVCSTRYINVNRLKSHFLNSEVVELSDNDRYISISMISNDGNNVIEGIVNLDNWLEKFDTQLPGLPWRNVPIRYLISWLKCREEQFSLLNNNWRVIDISIFEKKCTEVWLSIPAEPCAFICKTWPNNLLTSSNKRNSLLDVIFELKFMLGSSYLPLNDILTLGIGDLLQIETLYFNINIANYRIFTFNYAGQDEIIVNDVIRECQGEHRTEESMLLDWKMLPIQLEFTLDNQPFTLGEIDNLESGTIIKLKDNAEHNIKIYLNRKLYAQGELVLLEEGGLAVEVNKIIAQSDPHLGLCDAK